MRSRGFAVEVGNGFTVSHVAFEDGSDPSCLSIAEGPDGAIFLEQEVDFFETFLRRFLCQVSMFFRLLRGENLLGRIRRQLWP